MTDICGAECADGTPCQNPADSCPWHGVNKTPDRKQSKLQKNPELVDKVSDRLSAGDTVAEACAEVNQLSERSFYEWRRRGQEESDTVFSRFLHETTRARKGAGRQDRAQLQQAIQESMDTRTWYKLHMKQYGDQYGDEEADMREEGGVRQEIPEDFLEEWYGSKQ